jgi:hypothetical protein
MEIFLLAHEEVALPVPGHSTIGHFGGSLRNHDHVLDEPSAWLLPDGTGPADRPAAAQTRRQLLAQSPSALDEGGHVDGLVAHPHLRNAGVLTRQPRRDLLGRPPEVELCTASSRPRSSRRLRRRLGSRSGRHVRPIGYPVAKESQPCAHSWGSYQSAAVRHFGDAPQMPRQRPDYDGLSRPLPMQKLISDPT